MYEKVIKVFAMRCDEQHSYRGRFEEIENTLQAKQAFVGGYIEVVRLTDEIDLILNEEGKINNLPRNRAWVNNGEVIDIFHGNILACRHDAEGNFTSIEESDVFAILESCKPVFYIKGIPPLVLPESVIPNYEEK